MFEIYMDTVLDGRPYARFVADYSDADTAIKVASACARCNPHTMFRIVDGDGHMVVGFKFHDRLTTYLH